MISWPTTLRPVAWQHMVGPCGGTHPMAREQRQKEEGSLRGTLPMISRPPTRPQILKVLLPPNSVSWGLTSNI
jgi:hypothetical protein